MHLLAWFVIIFGTLMFVGVMEAMGAYLFGVSPLWQVWCWIVGWPIFVYEMAKVTIEHVLSSHRRGRRFS